MLEPVHITVALSIMGYALAPHVARGPEDAGSALPAAGPRHPRPRRLRSPVAAVPPAYELAQRLIPCVAVGVGGGQASGDCGADDGGVAHNLLAKAEGGTIPHLRVVVGRQDDHGSDRLVDVVFL